MKIQVIFFYFDSLKLPVKNLLICSKYEYKKLPAEH